MQAVDLFVIGGGSGGVRAARMAAGAGATVVLAEQGALGGTCVNLGCVPKKLFSYAASFGYDFGDAAGYGWQAGPARFDWPALRQAKDAEIKRLNGIYAANLEKAGVQVIKARASLAGPGVVTADGVEYRCRDIMIATGSQPAKPPTAGYAEHAAVSDDLFSLEELPAAAAVAGGGYIAVEFACILAGMGVATTLVHRGPTVLKNFDISIQQALLAAMRELGVELRLEHEVNELRRNDDGSVTAVFAKGGADLTVGLFLAATGRRPNTAGLGLEEAGVTLARNGAVEVNDEFTSSVAGIHAVGDVIDRVALTPVAIAEAMRFCALKYGSYGPPVDYALIPTAVFTHPNISTVGLTEQEARQKHPDCEVCVSEFTPMRYALSARKEKAMVKLVFAANKGRVLGAHMVGPDAGELMQGIAVALAKGATKEDFDAMVGIHPTTAEEFVSLR